MKPSKAIYQSNLKLYDLHVHTKWSRDSNADPRLVVKVSIKRGLSGIAITDHNEVLGAYEAKKYAPEGFEVIIGEEIRTNQGDLIGLNISDRISPKIDVEEAIDKIKEQGGLVLLPHPFSLYRRKIGGEILRVLDRVDLIEVVNGRSFLIDNLLSMRLAKRAKKPGVGGSDAHFYFEIGSVAVDLSNGLEKPGLIVQKHFRLKIVPSLLSGIINVAKQMSKFITYSKGDEDEVRSNRI
ncbi:MAG TPA: PHP domain-containing protein [Candidatus Korarchaeota archaeon]|nr:PHP domain-containing protein [Candidatus Korarchaeota archaeon]